MSAIDVVALAFSQGLALFLSRCFYYAVLTRGGSFGFICIAGLCALIPSFIITGSFGADLIVMVPLGIILYQASRVVELSFFLRFSLAVVCLFVHAFIMDYWWLGLSLSLRSLLLHAFLAIAMV